MTLVDYSTGVKVTLSYDGNGFPVVDIDTPAGCYRDRDGKPTIEVRLNNEIVRPLFVGIEG